MEKLYIEKGRSGKFGLNYSTILTVLIKEAAQCEHYASDLFIDWQSVAAFIEDPTPGTRTWLFGFRDMGVDGEMFVKARLESPGCYGNPYRVIYGLIIDKNADGDACMVMACLYRGQDVLTVENYEEELRKALPEK